MAKKDAGESIEQGIVPLVYGGQVAAETIKHRLRELPSSCRPEA
jgi:hypothetical protein